METTVKFSQKKLLVPALVIMALVIIAVVIWQILPQKNAALLPSGKPSLAAMYFENNTGDENLEHWRKALSELITADLAQSKYFTILGGDSLYNILKKQNLLKAKSYSSEDLKKVAEEGGVQNILRGSFTKAGDTFRINTMLLKASTGELIGTERVEGKGEEGMFAAVDELTRKIKANFKLSSDEIASDIDRDVGTITTGSPEAYKYYLEGVKHHINKDYQEAVQLYEKSVEIDPEFAMAYRALAVAYGNRGYRSKRKEHMQRALELSDRISDRERYQIQGDFYSNAEKTYDKAIKAFNKLLALYPDDIRASNNLGLIYGRLEEWDKAIEMYEISVKNSHDLLHYSNLADAYRAKGLFDKAKEILEDYIKNVSENDRIHIDFARHHLFLGKYDLALAEADKAFLFKPTSYRNFNLKGDIYFLSGHLAKAEKEYLRYLDARGKRSLGPYLKLASLYLTQGRFEKAKEQMRLAIDLAGQLGVRLWQAYSHDRLAYLEWKSGDLQKSLEELNKAQNIYVELQASSAQIFALSFKAGLYTEMGSMAEAKKLAVELKELIDRGLNKREMRYYHDLIGRIELKRKNFSSAIDSFKRAIALLSFQHDVFDEHASFIAPLALAFYKTDDVERAEVEYRRITSLTTGRTGFGDVYAKSFYMLGKIYEKKREQRKAIENYEKFLSLFKDADPGFPEVEDSKSRLAGLKNNL